MANAKNGNTDRIVFRGTLQQLLDKVESGEMVPKLQASHAPPCKFWTAFQVINGIRHVAPVIHGPKGCTYSVANAYKMSSCEYRGVPLEPTSCTAQNETDIVYGGEGKLLEAVKEADQRYHPDLIVILSCCCSGIFATTSRRSPRSPNRRWMPPSWPYAARASVAIFAAVTRMPFGH
jgi:nitrogenase molybdenum-iron protein alpha/beta subunit